MATMNVSLPGEMLAFVERQVEGGRYASSSEVVRDALRLLQRDVALETERLAVLRREVAIGLDAADEGRFSGMTVRDIMEEVLADGASR